MPDKQFFVEGDRKPDVYFALKDGDGAAIDVSAATASVAFRYRQVNVQGGTPAMGSIALTKPNGGADGVVKLEWGATDLGTPGDYNAEIEISWDGLKQTVPAIIEYNVRPKIDVT